MAPGCSDCEETRERLGLLEAEYKKLRSEFQHYREIRETEELIDSYYHNTVNKLTGRDVVSSTAAKDLSNAYEEATPAVTATSSIVFCAPRPPPAKKPWSRRSPPHF